MVLKEHAKIFAQKYKESTPTQEVNTCQYLEPSILVSPPRGSTIDKSDLDLLLPLQRKRSPNHTLLPQSVLI